MSVNKNTQKSIRTIATSLTVGLAFIIQLSGCGGGGGSSDTPPPPPPPPPISNCGISPANTTCKTIPVTNFGSRSFAFYEPSTRQDLAPVVIFLHGAPGSPASVENFFDGQKFVDDNGYLAAIPLGQGLFGWSSSVTSSSSISQDSQFVSDIIDDLVTNNQADPDKIFIAGFSAGGFMVYQLACEIPEKINSAFSVSGQYRGDLQACNAAFPLPIHHVHGTSDADVPDSGRSDNIATVQQTLDLWIGYNNCDGTSTDTASFVVTADNKSAITTEYQNCDASLKYTKVANGIHEQVYNMTELHRLMNETFEP